MSAAPSWASSSLRPGARGYLDRVAPPRVFLLAGLAVAGVQLVLAALLRTTELGAYFATCAAITIAIAVLARRLLAPRDGDDGRNGGVGPRPDDEGPPPWWPEFESQLRAWERGRDRARV